MNNLRKFFICLATAFAAGLLFVNLYTTTVDAPNWGHVSTTFANISRAAMNKDG